MDISKLNANSNLDEMDIKHEKYVKGEINQHNEPMDVDAGIYKAHITISALTYNTTFDNGGKPFDDGLVKDMLMDISAQLKTSKQSKQKDITKAIELANEIKMNLYQRIMKN